MSETEVPGDEPVVAPDVPADPAPAPVEPEPAPEPDPAVEAVATGDIDVSLLTYRGGTLDGQTGVVSGHDVVSLTTDAGETYTRTDEQQGNFRVYAFTVPEGEPVGGVAVFASPELENRLHADMAILAADAAKVEADVPGDEPAEPTAA